MHIPDHYLSPATCVVLGAAMIPVWTKSVAAVRRQIPKEKLPLLGAGAAFSFVIMMFNVPLLGGTTGHAVGAAALAILLGPHAACLAVSAALLVQALLFGDGGVLAFGANCFNMAFVMPFFADWFYRSLNRETKKGKYVAAATSAYLSLNLAALLAAIQFGIQPLLFRDGQGLPLYCPFPLNISIPAMMTSHLAIAGWIEALVALAVIAYFEKVTPTLLAQETPVCQRFLYRPIAALIVLSPMGLLPPGTAWGEWAIEEIEQIISSTLATGYIPAGMKEGFVFAAMLPDYTIKALPDAVAYILSALLGVLLTFAMFRFAALFANRQSRLEA